jgi:hypothetical protein
MIEKDAEAQVRALRLALAVEPQLRLDAARGSPAMVALLEHARDQLERAPRAIVPVSSEPPGARVWAGVWRGETPVALELAEGPAVVWLWHPGHARRAVLLDVARGASVAATLRPLSEVERLRPLVDAVQQAPRESRRDAVLTLAAALGVDAIAVVDAGAPTIYRRETYRETPSAALPIARNRPVHEPRSVRPWYKKAWPWVLIVGGAAAAATAVGVGVGLGTSQAPTLSCCR